MTDQAYGKTFAECAHRMSPIGARAAMVAHQQALASIGARLHRIPPSQEAQMATVIVRGVASGLATHVAIGPHQLVADEPVEDGGGGSGPNPYDLLLAALGT